jgi:penicillin-binding protein 1C
MWKHLIRLTKLQWTALFLLSIVIIYFAVPPKSPLFEQNYSTIVLSDNGSLLNAFTNSNEQWHFAPDTAELPDKLKIAAITYEDEGFYSHIGVDFKAIIRAVYQNAKQNKITSGASTIHMQLARMSEPKKRTYLNKLKETFFAIKLNLYFSKDSLLKLYLTHAPYGGNVVGYKTASYKFFGKDANSLTWSEAATLAVLPNAPGLIYPSKTSSFLKEKRDGLLKKLFEKGEIEEQTYQLAKLELIPDQFLAFESTAPHLARQLKNKYQSKTVLATTVNELLQKQCNQIAVRYAQIYAAYGINNLAIIVAETKTGAVKAYVGSPNFFDFNHGGQVDGVLAPRSSGSLLKPFLYALSIDEGLIIPNSLIRDLPTYFEGFSPKNANREYQGVVSAKEALVQSLNIPAVRLLNSYGIFQFYSFLKAAGVTTLFRNADEYGLPLIIGGSEVSMWDMVTLYRGLANDGVFRANYLLKDEKNSQSEQLISAGSCFLTLEMLKDLKRPDAEYFWARFSSSRPFAWKTGTSYGHKDAWAVGVNPEYTIAVWVGNFNGASNKNLSGAASAGPILFDVLQVLPLQNPKQWFEKNDIDFKQQLICKLSGFRATEACAETEVVEIPYGAKPLAACDYHQFKFFSKDEMYQSCSKCWHIVGSVKKSVTIYPPDIAYYLREKGQYISKIASHYPKCPAYKIENSIKIIYPNMEAMLFLPRDFDGKIQPVVCKLGYIGSGKKVYWYLDNCYLGTTENEHKMAVIFNVGWNKLKVMDENGAEDSQKVFAVINQ